ncbi:uncharacterized protein LOC108744453 [Agrilus planipennis]|uniref:Uncharacterized protein LOC108744453 n=1 Tax=Agrilus planipennis TaxID=224129 RepID=A0A1W4XIC0_AGRPL|nr:uncharacterized protein LOC108744453 [Agrilus planipennis]XP_018335738.1 uncharacterized protein LOC108744453 [Agrilus planipennis]XP_018335746.1 uncharacterized protein LOC108744453 [Agrilus planipennis]
MALKLRKEMKKSSYYVWFLGAKEARGLRGPEAVMPALEHLMQRERDTEPHKVTLQVSQKGLKIVQNVVRETGSGKTGKPKLETVKHLIPSDSVAYAHQRDDIVVCVLLLMNPVTGWPLHVHAYRCDSLDTARLLHHQLQTLSDRPDNQKRWREVEAKIMDGEMKEMGRQDSSLGSDTGASSARGSDSGEERSSGGLGSDLPPVRTSILYDSVAAELRARLGGASGPGSRPPSQPLLLPPRDYDTVHRQRGNLQGIELRRCLNTSIVGRAAANNTVPNTTIANGSAASSGIGSDHASPSPDSPPEIGGPFGTCDGNSTSDEEWNADTAESTMYLMPDGSPELTLPRPHTQTEIRSSRHYPDGYKSDRYPSSQNSYSRDASSNNAHHDNKYSDNTRSLEKGKGRFMENPLNKYAKNFRELEEEHVMGKNGDPTKNHVDYQVKREFESKREILKRDFEKKDIERREYEKREYERKMYEKNKEVKDFDKLPRLRYGAETGRDDEFKTEIRNAVKCRKENTEEVDNRKPRYNFGEEYVTEQQVR